MPVGEDKSPPNLGCASVWSLGGFLVWRRQCQAHGIDTLALGNSPVGG